MLAVCPLATRTLSGGESCPMCGETAEAFPQSHIYPAWMGRLIQQDDKALVAFSSNRQYLPKMVMTHGVFDRIVCPACEKSFGPADAYFSRFWARKDRFETHHVSEDVRVNIFREVEVGLIQRFFLTCLYRAHLTQRPGYEYVNLGPYVKPIRDALEGPCRFFPDIDVVMFREAHKFANIIGSPHLVRLEGFRFQALTIPGFKALVKVDKKPLTGGLAYFLLQDVGSVVMLEMWRPTDAMWSTLGKAHEIHGDRIAQVSKLAFGR